MYSDQKTRKFPRLCAGIAVCLLMVLLLAVVLRGSTPDLKAQGAASIKEVIEKSALQCYVVEGIYPPDLDYLEENYGLTINQEDYYIHYEVYASNQPPTVQVVLRQKPSKR